MAFPTVQTRNESANTGAVTDHVVSLPTGIQDGDLLIVIIAGGGTNALQFGTVTGWSELLDENNTFGCHVWYRLADGTEGATQTFTSGASSRSAHVSYRISGAENPATQAPQISAVGTGTSDAPNPNTVTPTGGAKDYLFFTFFALGSGEIADTDGWVNNAATNYSQLLQKSSGTGGTNVGARLGSSERTANVSAEDAVWPAASLDASIAWRAFTVAVHPAAAHTPTLSSFTVPLVAAVLLAWQPAAPRPQQAPRFAPHIPVPVTDAPPLRLVQPPAILRSWRGRAGMQGRTVGRDDQPAADVLVAPNPWAAISSWYRPQPPTIPRLPGLAALLQVPADAPPLRVLPPATILQWWKGRAGQQGRTVGRDADQPQADLPVVAHPWNAIRAWFQASPRRPAAPLFIPISSDDPPLKLRAPDLRAWRTDHVRIQQPSSLAALLFTPAADAPPPARPSVANILQAWNPPAIRLPSLVQSAALFPVVVADAPPLLVRNQSVILRAWKVRDRGRIGAQAEPPPPTPNDPPLRRHPPPSREWWPDYTVSFFLGPAVSIPADVVLPRAAVPQNVLNAWRPPYLRLPSLRKEPHWLYFLGDAPPVRLVQPPAILRAWVPAFRPLPELGVIVQEGPPPVVDNPPLRLVQPASILQAWRPLFRPLPRLGVIVQPGPIDSPPLRLIIPASVLRSWVPAFVPLPILRSLPQSGPIPDAPPLVQPGIHARLVRAWIPGPPMPQQRKHQYPAFIPPDAPPLMVRMPPHIIEQWRKAEADARPTTFKLPWLPEGIPVVYTYTFTDESGPVYVFRDESGHLYYFQDESGQP